MPHKPWHLGKGAKWDHIFQLNCGEVHSRASYKTARTWENFNSWGAKMILLSDKLWLIANNSKSLASRSKSIKRNDLVLWNLPYNGIKIYQDKLMIFGSDRKKWQNADVQGKKGHIWKEWRFMTQGRRKVEVGTLLLGNDKNQVISSKTSILNNNY